MRFTIGTFSINQQRGNPGHPNTEIEGLVSECGTWGIAHIPSFEYGGDGFYTVTHIQSGLKSNTHAKSLAEAGRYCVEMNARGDWSGDLALELDYAKGCANSSDPKFTAMAKAHAETMKIILAERESTRDTQTTPEVSGSLEGRNASDGSNAASEKEKS